MLACPVSPHLLYHGTSRKANKDCAPLLLCSLAQNKGQPFNAGSDDQNYQIAQLGDLIKELIPDVQVIHQGEDVDRRNYRASFARICTEPFGGAQDRCSRSIRKHPGFTPRRTVADGITSLRQPFDKLRTRLSTSDRLSTSLEIKAAIEDGRITDYRDARYSNYKTLSEEDNIHLIRHTRMNSLYAGGVEVEGG